MPAWILTALNMIRTALVGGTGRSLVTGAAAGQAGEALLGPLIGMPSFLGDGGEPKRRRRRRRALTASDKADIAFIASMLGKPAGKDFAVIIASRC